MKKNIKNLAVYDDFELMNEHILSSYNNGLPNKKPGVAIFELKIISF